LIIFLMEKELVRAKVITLAVALVIIAGSSVPGDNIPTVFKFTPDKLIHCLEYAVLGGFIFRWIRLELGASPMIRIRITTFLLGSFMGILDENYQRLIPGRHPDFWDWVLDSIGVVIAIVIMSFLDHRNKK